MLVVDLERCNGCGACVRACPVGAITLQEEKAVIDDALCEDCRTCQAACPEDAILVMEMIDPAMEAGPITPAPVKATPASQQAAAPARDTGIWAALINAAPRVLSLALDWLERRPQQTPNGKPETSPKAQTASSCQNHQRGTRRQRSAGQGKGCQRRRRGNR